MGISSKDFAVLCRNLGVDPLPKFAQMETGQKQPAARSKYNSKRKEIDGIVFASCAEARAYQELKLAEQAGRIADLKLQPRFLLQAAFRDTRGKWNRAISYVADFAFLRIRGEHERDQQVVVDVKGVRTPVFNMKEKMFRQKYPYIHLEIWDTRKKRIAPAGSAEGRER